MSLFKYLHWEDVLLYWGLGFASAIVFHNMVQTLHEFREATRVTTEQKQQDIIGQHTEDAISVDTLGELYNSPNWDIKQASVKILVERVVQRPNFSMLFRHAHSKNKQKREEAMTILAYLATSMSRTSLRTPSIYPIIVNTLVSYLPESATRSHEPHTDWKTRSKTEECAFIILRSVMTMSPNGSIKQWLDAGLVSKYLAHYPFGGAKAKELQGAALLKMRKKLIDDIRTRSTDDTDLEFIFIELLRDGLGKTELAKFKLVGSYLSSDDMWKNMTKLYLTVPYSNTVMHNTGDSANGGDDDEARAARRRRRREAVVIGDAGQPLSQDNIYNADTELVEYEGFSRVA